MRFHEGTREVRRSTVRCAFASLFFAACICMVHPAAAQPKEVLRFGALPIGDLVESRKNWEPLLSHLAREIGRPIIGLAVSTHEELDRAIQRREVDIALLPGKMALDAVSAGQMRVIAEVKRRDGPSEHQAVLLARKAPPLNGLNLLLDAPERWVIARGPRRSVSGFVVPQTQLFLPQGIDIETRFRNAIIGTHQETALAVANGTADVATNNTTDFQRFQSEFPVEAARLHVIWRSQATPAAQILVRVDLSEPTRRKLRDALTNYGSGAGAIGAKQRDTLQALRASYGYVAASNSALLPAAQLEYEMARQRALSSQWTNAAAKDARLQRIEREHAQLTSVLLAERSNPATAK